MRPVAKGYIPKYHKVKSGYCLDEDIYYYSHRYNRYVTIKKGTIRDGASGAFDIRSLSWWVHDELCDRGTWDRSFGQEKASPVTNWQASCVLSDILYNEGRWFRARSWLIATFALGCKNARKHGMFRRKK